MRPTNRRAWPHPALPILAVVVMLALAVAYQWLPAPGPASGPSDARNTKQRDDRRNAVSSGDQAIEDAFAGRRSGVWVEASGTIERLLPDDRSGSRHQRFIVRLSNGRTLLFAHNVDLAPRVPLEAGSWIRFRGMYEWSEPGGTVHWTHHDPDGGHAGGQIELEGRRYR